MTPDALSRVIAEFLEPEPKFTFDEDWTECISKGGMWRVSAMQASVTVPRSYMECAVAMRLLGEILQRDDVTVREFNHEYGIIAATWEAWASMLPVAIAMGFAKANGLWK